MVVIVWFCAGLVVGAVAVKVQWLYFNKKQSKNELNNNNPQPTIRVSRSGKRKPKVMTDELAYEKEQLEIGENRG